MKEFLDAAKHVDWEKCGGTVPVILQSAATGKVLDLRLVNRDLFDRYRHQGADANPVWWSYMQTSDVFIDCDSDSLLCKVPRTVFPATLGGDPSCYFPYFLAQTQKVLNWRKIGDLLPVVVQEFDGTVLMQAWMNQEALRKTIETKRMWYWSRTRKCLWEKGSTSGQYQILEGNDLEVFAHCEYESLLFQVRQQGGAACHEGYKSCFFRRLGATGLEQVLSLAPDAPDLISGPK